MAWNDVELRHLQAFLAVHDARSFGRAAEALGYSQAAVSQQIAALERATGAQLFDRPGGPRPVEPTDAAAELLPHARAIFAELGEAEAKLGEVDAGRRGRLAVGSFESVSSAFLPDVVARLTRERPDVSLELFEEMVDERRLIGGVLSGELDASFVPSAVDEPGLRTIPLLSDPYVAVIPRSFADQLRNDRSLRDGAPMPTVDLEAVGRSPLIGHVDHDQGQSVINLALRSIGVTPRYVFRSADNGALQSMVRSGLGIAVMPLLAVDTRDPDLVIARTEPAIPLRSITFIVRSGPLRSAALAGFLDIVEQTADEYAAHRTDTTRCSPGR